MVITRTGSAKLVSSCKEDFADLSKLSVNGTCVQTTFSQQQDAAVEATVEGSGMLRYNDNKGNVFP